MATRALLLLAASTLFTTAVVAYPQIPPPRNHYVFHVYVDPNFGDDTYAFDRNNAWGFNGSWQSGRFPLQPHPDTSANPDAGVSDPLTSGYIGGLQIHAPYSFRTIGRAIEYVCTKGPTGRQYGNGWFLDAVVNGKRISWIVIHCLPGLYGPTWDGLSTSDPESGLNWNGEVFPIELPYGISLQGTSALDTIIDLREQYDYPHPWAHAVKIVQPGQPSVYPQGGPHGPYLRDWMQRSPLLDSDPFSTDIPQLARTFVDGFTIRGTTLLHPPTAPPQPTRFTYGAGIFMQRVVRWWDFEEPPLRPTISNCFINHCGVGIAVIAFDDGEGQLIWKPILLNNTFADNLYVDVYNGSSDLAPNPGPNPISIGHNLLRVVNNICLHTSPFAGMHEGDLQVMRGGSNYDFNAFPEALPLNPRNALSGWTTEWPLAQVRTPASPPAAIQPMVNTLGFTSNLFFVNYVFAATIGARTPHDYRLVPFALAVPLPQSPNDPNGMLNPMVNRGVALDPATMRIDFANGLRIDDDVDAAGLPKVACDAYTTAEHLADMENEPFQVFDAWDWDTNGFMNPRVFSHPSFPGNGFGDVDLGAHELGELLMSGYLDDTRMFSHGGPVADRDRIFFFNVPNGGPYSRPVFNLVFGGLDWSFNGLNTDWFVNAQTNPSGLPRGNYCYGDIPPFVFTWRERMMQGVLSQPPTPGQKGYLPIMRNFECDFSPHLLADIHPLWAQFGSRLITDPCNNWLPNTLTFWDFYASNAWHSDVRNYSHQRQPYGLGDPPSPDPCDLRIFIDSPFLFYNPSPGFPNSPAQSPSYLSNVTSGHLNPPGTDLDMFVGGDPTTGIPRLMVESFPVLGSFGPFWPCTGQPPPTYDVDVNGIGDSSAGCPDQVPQVDGALGLGMRINCALGVDPNTGSAGSNLQTFLVYSNDTTPSQPASASSPGRATSTSEAMRPTAATLERLRSGLNRQLRLSPSR